MELFCEKFSLHLTVSCTSCAFFCFSSKSLNTTGNLSKLEVVIIILQRLAHIEKACVFYWVFWVDVLNYMTFSLSHPTCQHLCELVCVMCIAQNASLHIWPLAQLINRRDGSGPKVKSHKKCRERRLGRTMARRQDDSDCRRKKGFWKSGVLNSLAHRPICPW